MGARRNIFAILGRKGRGEKDYSKEGGNLQDWKGVFV